jgi:hypothetical protein
MSSTAILKIPLSCSKHSQNSSRHFASNYLPFRYPQINSDIPVGFFPCGLNLRLGIAAERKVSLAEDATDAGIQVVGRALPPRRDQKNVPKRARMRHCEIR